MPQMPEIEDPHKQDHLLKFIDYNYALICLCCGSKVLDPDKKKGQINLKGKCPSCGKESKQEQKKSKKQRKAEKRAAAKAAELAARAKY